MNKTTVRMNLIKAEPNKDGKLTSFAFLARKLHQQRHIEDSKRESDSKKDGVEKKS